MDNRILIQKQIAIFASPNNRILKPSTPKGTRDFSPAELAGRNFIFETLKNIFSIHGYQPIETPSMESLETLTGKYGEEGDRLIFKILNSGDFLAKVDPDLLNTEKAKELGVKICEKALRYDLTVPFARYVVQHQNDISFPFKRYQIQPVWRADRPQKGRYREFYQCDVDVIGSDSLINEVELIQVISKGFDKLGVKNVTIAVNNRKILSGIANALGIENKFTDFVVALDKWDKIGVEGVKTELSKKGFDEEKVGKIINCVELKNLDDLRELLKDNEGSKGLDELSFVLDRLQELGIGSVVFQPHLARGLDYYTGIIIEVSAEGFSGSICAGGRYDDLTSIFGLKGISGVGVSFGADRIYDLMKEEGLFDSLAEKEKGVLFVNFGEREAMYCMQLLENLRKENIPSELYPDSVKMKKQMAYANAKGMAYVVMVGSDEMDSQMVTIKNMSTGEQKQVSSAELVNHIINK